MTADEIMSFSDIFLSYFLVIIPISQDYIFYPAKSLYSLRYIFFSEQSIISPELYTRSCPDPKFLYFNLKVGVYDEIEGETSG